MALVARAKCCSINFGKRDGVDPHHQQYQSLSFHPRASSRSIPETSATSGATFSGAKLHVNHLRT
jgi:hypothetical protein